MRLKRLTVHGFKSFADKTHFELESELTGIVGPNGCGKSNVVDALKWVLGDQRVRSLRGKEMTDVIFKGAEGRDGSHQARVEITLSDEDGDRAEMTIGRQLNKDKESDYLLNGDTVRLKDVRDVLMNTGLGVGAYSVMEQGRIDAVLSANPEDRRAIFEEAAGISRFKLQKRETLRKLDRTEINLARVKDLLDERARRIRSLKIQAGKARRYRELRAELRDHRTAVAVIEARLLRTRQAEQEARLEELAHSLTESERLCTEFEAERERCDQLIDARSREHEALQEEIRSVQSRQDAAAHQAEAHDHRAADQRSHAAENRRRHDELLEQDKEKTDALEAAKQRIQSIDALLVEIGTEMQARRTAVKNAQREARELQETRERVRQRTLEWMSERTRAHNTAHDSRAGLKALDARRTSLIQRREDLDAELTGLEAQVGAVDDELRSANARAADLAAEERMSLEELRAADAEAAELAHQESELRQQQSSVAGRLQVLADMESHMEGLDSGPRYLLQEKPEGLRGRLIDLFDTDVSSGPALEAALGMYVQALVVDSREHADAMHAMLRDKGKGRAILLIADEISEPRDVSSSPFGFPAGATSLISHVRFSESATELARWLLRGVCVVESLADAPTDRPDLCFVTPKGGLLCGPRIEGGSEEGQSGLVVRKAKMQALSVESEALTRELDGLLKGKQGVQARVTARKEEVRHLGELVQEMRSRIHGQETQRNGLLRRISEGERDLEDFALRVRELDQQRATVRADMTTLLLRAFCLGRREAAESDREAAIGQELASAQREAERVGREEQDVQLRQVQCRSDREAARDACRHHEQTLTELAQTVAVLSEREKECLQKAEEHDASAESCRVEIEKTAAELSGLSEKRDHAAHALAAARSEFTATKDNFAAEQQRKAEIAESTTEERLALGETEHNFKWLETRLYEEVQIALRRCLGEVEGMGLTVGEIYGPSLAEATDEQRSSEPDVEIVSSPAQLIGPPIPPEMLADELALNRLWESEEFDVDASRKNVEVLQARVERLGSVNLDAVAELEEEEADLVLTEQEVKDLTESRTSLVEALRRMEAESRVLFEETFTAARENFQVLFRKLFQGGRADMFLADEDDALEAGIDIMARPPGKELQSINLLSGGERTLTALAILFAVFKVKPSPFCILDEVDAALDDTNVERFLRVLHDFVGPTQFCVVTHHKRTMAACNTLYGITMQRRGVSSRIAVNLEQVDELTETGLNGGSNGGANAAENRGRNRATEQRIAGEEALGF